MTVVTNKVFELKKQVIYAQAKTTFHYYIEDVMIYCMQNVQWQKLASVDCTFCIFSF